MEAKDTLRVVDQWEREAHGDESPCGECVASALASELAAAPPRSLTDTGVGRLPFRVPSFAISGSLRVLRG